MGGNVADATLLATERCWHSSLTIFSAAQLKSPNSKVSVCPLGKGDIPNIVFDGALLVASDAAVAGLDDVPSSFNRSTTSSHALDVLPMLTFCR